MVEIQRSKVLGLILARRGSKRVPNKNILNLKGFSLIDWAAFAALESKVIDDIVISTDYDGSLFEHLNIHHRARPSHLCTDAALSKDAIIDAVDYWESYRRVKVGHVILLEPPCPFRNGKLIDDVFRQHFLKSASSTVTLKLIDDNHPVRIKKLDENSCVSPAFSSMIEPQQGLPTQLQADLFLRDTAVYVFNVECLRRDPDDLYGKSQYGYVNKNVTVNIDTALDHGLANYLIESDQWKNFNMTLPSIPDYL